MNASSRFLSSADAKPHHAGAAYVNRLTYNSQRFLAHAVTTENFKGMHCLRAFPDDVAYMFADREVVRDCDAEYFNGGDARNIRQCGWQVTVLKLAPAAVNITSRDFA